MPNLQKFKIVWKNNRSESSAMIEEAPVAAMERPETPEQLVEER